MAGLASFEIFHKEKLGIVIDSVQIDSKDRIEIVWKTDDWFFGGRAGEKEVLALK